MPIWWIIQWRLRLKVFQGVVYQLVLVKELYKVPEDLAVSEGYDGQYVGDNPIGVDESVPRIPSKGVPVLVDEQAVEIGEQSVDLEDKIDDDVERELSVCKEKPWVAFRKKNFENSQILTLSLILGLHISSVGWILSHLVFALSRLILTFCFLCL